MNKQQLASIIWESVNQMRSMIEANEYKDFILGFIFYKYLSDKEITFLKSQNYKDEDIKNVTEDDKKQVVYIKKNLGYFISYDNLFSTWLEKGNDFSVDNVRDALSAFDRNIDDAYKKVFENIFKTLRSSLSKLGDTAAKQTKAINKLLKLIKRIPMDNKQDYDVLGFIYEYLIGMFAANAGKKGGEFYTPNEVSILMSEIISEHLKDRKQISIYDSASGSGSLLINIGASAAKYIKGKNKIDYYAQELKEYTYNLTRMNLIMRGIEPHNIFVRNGDTLEDDWPFFEDNDIENSYKLISVDAVVSNPPYSQKWDIKDKEFDPRYKDYGVAPKNKSDLAFLLHDLYHLKDNGIMTIVLPHGVLYRSGDEAVIRENLIEKNKIEAIIGLPSNVFFGTGIPTIIMVLKKNRTHDNVLIVDASKGFEKVKIGKNNKLRARDIKKIVDTVVNNTEIPKFSKLVSKEQIRENEYNLNISQYVDSSEDDEKWDINAIMYGGIPKNEIGDMDEFWNEFPNLKEDLFEEISPKHMKLKVADLEGLISNHESIIKYKNNLNASLDSLPEQLKEDLIDNILDVDIFSEKNKIVSNIFESIEDINLIDKYRIYQIFSNKWDVISTDLEMIKRYGFEVINDVEPNMVIKKNSKDNEVIEVQEGWRGKILPFDLVQKELLKDDVKEIEELNNRLLSIQQKYDEIIESFDEEEKESGILNEDKTAFINKEVKNKVDEIFEDIESEEINALFKYLDIPNKKSDKFNYMSDCKIIDWNNIEKGANGYPNKKTINDKIKELKQEYKFDKDSFEANVLTAFNLIEEEKEIKRDIKVKSEKLETQTRTTIENLNEDTTLELVEHKWITSLFNLIKEIGDEIVEDLIYKVEHLLSKYEKTFNDIEENIKDISKEVSNALDELEGDDFDIQGLTELKKILEVSGGK